VTWFVIVVRILKTFNVYSMSELSELLPLRLIIHPYSVELRNVCTIIIRTSLAQVVQQRFFRVRIFFDNLYSNNNLVKQSIRLNIS